MRVDVYATAHNEARLLPYFLRYYEQVADRIFVWEDESTDETRRLLLAHPKVTVLDVLKHGVDDQYWVTELYPQYLHRSLDATWAVFVDIDEFLYHPHLLDVLRRAAGEGTALIQCEGFQMVAESEPTTSGQIFEQITTGFPDPLQNKTIVVSPRQPVIYSPGRHWIQFVALESSGIRWPTLPERTGPYMKGWLRMSDLPEADRPVGRADLGIKLLHYRYLGSAYATARSAENLSRMSAMNVKNKWHRHNKPGHEGPQGVAWFEAHKAEAVSVVP